MDKNFINEAARILVNLRMHKAPMENLPERCRPRDEEEAYKIQDELHRQFTKHGFGTRIGYKIGCTTPVMQNYMNINHPCVGGIFEGRRHYSPVSLDYYRFCVPGIECEIAVELSQTLDARSQPISQGEAEESIAALYPAIEVVDNRYKDIMALGTPSLIADDFCQSVVVLGPKNKDLKGMDLETVTGQTFINDVEVGNGDGRDVLGHPLNALIWLANHLALRSRILHPGEIIFLGSLVQCQWLQPNDTARIKIGGLGSVTAKFPGQ